MVSLIIATDMAKQEFSKILLSMLTIQIYWKVNLQKFQSSKHGNTKYNIGK